MEDYSLDIPRQVSYWQRCLKCLLPTDYTSTDSSRVMLGFLILSALDLLGAGAETLHVSDTESIKSWILSCQHPNGGFCGSPNHRYPDLYYDERGRGEVDPANLPATFFALLSLNFVGRISDVSRIKCLRWLKRLQRVDGSFGEFIGQGGKVDGGRDMRYCHFAAGVRWMLRGDLGFIDGENFADIDIDGLIRHIQSGETYEGGIGESSQHESHGGYTYCAIASLSFLNQLPHSKAESPPKAGPALVTPKEDGRDFTKRSCIIRWLLSRQLAYSDEHDVERGRAQDFIPSHPHAISDQETTDTDFPFFANLSLSEPLFIGFNGRANKEADTCYCFYVSASLKILGRGELVNRESARRFLLGQTQHRIGGFGKQPGYPPDLYHSYLGLACLAMMKEPGLKDLDPVLCVSVQAKDKLGKIMQDSLIPTNSYWKHGLQRDESTPKVLKDVLQKFTNKNCVEEASSLPFRIATTSYFTVRS